MTVSQAKILEEARYYYERAKSVKEIPALIPTDGWQEVIDRLRTDVIRNSPDAVQAIHHIQEYLHFIDSFKTNRFLTHKTVDHYDQWLASHGQPLSHYSQDLQESPYTNPRLVVSRNGTQTSAASLWYLCTCQQILKSLKTPPHNVLEIGCGYGGLARVMKLLRPTTRYFIVDLPETLFFSYLYLRLNFPQAHCLFITENNKRLQLGPLNGVDFIFVPTACIESLSGLPVDLVINTASLGEMRQQAVNRYMQFIQEDLETCYFYSVNRYGRHPFDLLRLSRSLGAYLMKMAACKSQYSVSSIGSFFIRRLWQGIKTLIDFPPREFISEDGCECAVMLDPYWKIHLWSFQGRDSHYQIDPSFPAYLEILAQRVSKRELSDADCISRSQLLLTEAMQMAERNIRWQYLMWESIRLNPTLENLHPFVEFLKKSRYREFSYYDELEKKHLNSPVSGQPAV